MKKYIVSGFYGNIDGILCIVSGQENFRSPFPESRIILVDNLSFKTMEDEIYNNIFMKGSGVVVARELESEEKKRFYLNFETEDEFFQRVILDAMIIKEVVRGEFPVNIFPENLRKIEVDRRGAYFNSQKNKFKPSKITQRRRWWVERKIEV